MTLFQDGVRSRGIAKPRSNGVACCLPPRLRVKKVLGCLAIILGSNGTLAAQTGHGTIEVSISVRSVNLAHVEERYVMTSSPSELRVLTRPCAAIENVRMERGGVVLNVVESRDGPWITLRDTTLSDSLPLFVRYDVRLTGTGSIPLLHLAAPLARTNATPLGAVSVEVTLADGASRVAFPHMTRQAQNRWAARYVAVPSFVEISGAAVTACGEPVETGDNGGLVWRFFLLLGIMVAWVPLYLAWARRSGESA